ncbi:hypothetical protein [uncultured Tessaracoccus sp.]|uniref:hypothetical protein n=1 Tax=uncultured Tessaracoccus sp. TaxID=905023 RepID=UPI0025EFB69B|nr:hypothetical protein [uncultured Tessaracoccus sp.]
MRPEGIRKGRRVTWAALVALLVVPLLVAGTLLGLVRRGGEDRVVAAIVNLDEGTEVDGKPVPMGRQLAAEMMGYEGDNIHWILADEPSGNEGLRSGEYAAVVTIPTDFSERAMSFSANDADRAEKARVQVTVSRNAPAFDADLAQEIARIATQSLNKFLTSQYLDGIYVGFNEVGGQFQQIVDGANQLHDGSTKLSDGVRDAADGSAELSDGMDQLSDNSGRLRAGGRKLADGTRQLSDGVQQLAGGAQQLLPGVAQYADGAARAIGGVAQLEDGLDQAVQGLDAGGQGDLSQLQQLVDGANKLRSGSRTIAEKQQELADGADEMADGIDQFVTPIEGLDGLVTDEMIAGVKQFRGRVGELGQAVVELDDDLRGYADGSLPPPKEVTAAAERLKQQFRCDDPDPAVCEQLRAAYERGVDAAIIGGFRQGAQEATDFLHTVDPDTGKTYLEIAKGAEGPIGEVLDQVADGLEQAQGVVPGLVRLRDGSRKLADGAQQLADGGKELAGGNAKLADGVQRLATELPAELQRQMGRLRAGLVQLRDGAGRIVDGAKPLVANSKRLGDGATKLNDGIQRLARETGALPSGVLTYVDGVWQYSEGVDEAAAGAGELADGMGKLGGGARELDQGLGTFAGKLADGKKQIPSFSEGDRSKLADVVSSPVDPDTGLMTRGTLPLTAVILVAAVWLAALAACTVARPVPSDVVRSNASNTALWARTVAVPTAIVTGVGALLGVVGGVLWHMSVARTAGLVVILAGLGFVFTLTHHALVAWLGHVGRGISLVLLAVTIALGLSSGVPTWLGVVASVSPLQSGMLLGRAWLAGAPVITALGLMVFVAAVFAGLSWAAIALRRQLTPRTFRLRHA